MQIFTLKTIRRLWDYIWPKKRSEKQSLPLPSLSAGHDLKHLSVKANTMGGDPAFSGALGVLDLENPQANGDAYATWASSVKDFPDIINQKVPGTL